MYIEYAFDCSLNGESLDILLQDLKLISADHLIAKIEET